MGDRVMMEEVLELLASGSPDQASAESTTVSSASGSNHSSMVSDLNHGSSSGTNHGDKGDDDTTDPRTDDRLEEIYPADRRTVQFHPALQSPWAPPLLHHPPPFFPVNPSRFERLPMSVQATTSVAIPVPPMASMGPQTPRIRSRSWRESPPKKPRPSPPSTTSNVLPTGQKVKVTDSAEFDELRRKLRMQTASRRYRKRKKEEAHQQKSKILELQAELTRLRDLETQTKQYQQRPIASLEEELQMHQDEISDLSQKVENAANEELDWIKLMSSNPRK